MTLIICHVQINILAGDLKYVSFTVLIFGKFITPEINTQNIFMWETLSLNVYCLDRVKCDFQTWGPPCRIDLAAWRQPCIQRTEWGGFSGHRRGFLGLPGNVRCTAPRSSLTLKMSARVAVMGVPWEWLLQLCDLEHVAQPLQVSDSSSVRCRWY